MLRIDPVPRLKNQFFRQGKTERLFLHRASGSVLNMLYIIISHLVLRLNYCRYFFFALNFLPWEFLIIKKLEIVKTKPTFIISVLKLYTM